MASNGKAVTGAAVMARSADEGKKKWEEKKWLEANCEVVWVGAKCYQE